MVVGIEFVVVVPVGTEAEAEAAEATRRRRVGEDGEREEEEEVDETATTLRSRGERVVAALAAATARLVSHIHEGERERKRERERASTRLAAADVSLLFALACVRERVERGERAELEKEERRCVYFPSSSSITFPSREKDRAALALHLFLFFFGAMASTGRKSLAPSREPQQEAAEAAAAAASGRAGAARECGVSLSKKEERGEGGRGIETSPIEIAHQFNLSSVLPNNSQTVPAAAAKRQP